MLSAAAAALVCLAGGCVNVPNPLPGKDPVPVKPDTLPVAMRWVDTLGANIDKTVEITTLDIDAPYNIDIPRGFSAAGAGLNRMVCVAPNGASVKFSIRENLPGGTLDFWRKIITRSLVQKYKFRVLEDKGFRTPENLNGWIFTGQRIVKGKVYKYKLALISWCDELYLAELSGAAKAFDATVSAFDKSLKTFDLAFWRMQHDANCTNPFLRYDPVRVIPQAERGLFKTSWTPIQLGFIPYVQLWDSPGKVYGLALNFFYLKQQRVGGISYSLFNAVKESYGIQLGGFFSAAEENCGLSIGVLYNAVRVNNGLTIGLITRGEEGSHGVQIGLLNFNSSADYPFCLPFINFPLYSCNR